MLTDGQTDGQTEWGIAIALSQIGWLGAKTSLMIQMYFQGNQTKKSFILFFSLIHNEITWCVPDFLQKGRSSLICPDLKIDYEISWRWLTCIVHFIDKKTNRPSKNVFFFSKMNKWKVGRTHFQKVRPKGKQCAMTGALFSEKCARGNFSVPFAQWRSPNASLLTCGWRSWARRRRTSARYRRWWRSSFCTSSGRSACSPTVAKP